MTRRDGGDVFGPAGTRVRLVVHGQADRRRDASRWPPENLASLWRRSTIARSSPRSPSTRTAAYRVALADADGLTSEGMEYFIRVMDDRPPEVHILRPIGDQGITPLEEVPIEARADDDYGIASFELVYSVSGRRREGRCRSRRVGGTNVGAHRIADARGRRSERQAWRRRSPTTRARATSPAAKQSTLSRSEIFFLEVKPFNEEYSMAQSQAMAAATGTAARKPDRGAEGDHQRDVEPRAAFDGRPIAGRHQGDRRRAGRAEGARRAIGRAVSGRDAGRRSGQSSSRSRRRPRPAGESRDRRDRRRWDARVQQLGRQAHVGRHPARDGGA